jgi:hypothetical protein
MKNPFSVAPRCVQWAAVILAAVPVFNIVVALNVVSLARYLQYGWVLLASIAVELAFAVGLLLGMNLVRLLFAAMVLYNVATSIISWSQEGLSSMSLVSDLTARIAPCLSLVLVFLPAANGYFSGKPGPEPKEEKVEKGEGRALGPVIRIAGLLALLVVGIPLVRHFRPAFEDASSMNRAQKIAYLKYQQDMQDLQIVANLQLLGQAQSQYFFEHPGATAKYSDLVGSNRFIKQLTSAASEKYPDEFVEGREPVAILPDGTTVSFDHEALKAKRTSPR